MYNYFHELWDFLLLISPYLLLGFLAAGILSILVKQEIIEQHLGKKKGFLSILKAGLFGVPLPLCSCSVIPVSASLKRHGAGKGAITSFLLSTPQTGVDSIMVTYGLLGPVVAIIRPIIALLTGLLSGTLVHMYDRQYDTNGKDEDCHETCCNNSNESIVKRIFKYSFITLPKDIVKPLIIGILIASLINIFPSSESIIENYVGTGLFSMFMMIIIGLPLYICATASIPIALAFMDAGVTLGAAIVFLMVGPATNTTSIATMIKILGKKSTLITIISLIIFSVCCGLLIDTMNISIPILVNGSHNHATNSLFPSITSIILIMIMLNTLLMPYYPQRLNNTDNLTILSIKGMTCDHCISTVETAIKSIGGQNVEVNLQTSTAQFSGDVDLEKVKEKIISIGYEIKG